MRLPLFDAALWAAGPLVNAALLIVLFIRRRLPQFSSLALWSAFSIFSAAVLYSASHLGPRIYAHFYWSAEAIDALLQSIGYRFRRDTANNVIAHPAAFVTLTADGRVARTLSSLALQPADLRLALLEAGEGKIGGLAGRLALLCYGFDTVHGIYTAQIIMLLRVGGGATVAILAALLGFLFWRAGKREASV